MKKTAFMIMIISVVSKVFGFLRDLILSYFYGASGISDAYLISMTIPGVIFSFIGVGLVNGFIPMYTNIENEEGIEKADRFTNNLTNIVMIFTALLFLAGVIFTEPLVKLFATGFSGDTLKLAVLFSRITMVSIFFVGLTYIFSGYLQLKENYLIPAMIGLPLNIFTIVGIVISSRGNTTLLAIGSLIATVSQFLLLVPSIIKKGFKYERVVDFKDKYIKRMIIIVIPLVIGSSVDQVNILIDRTLASSISVGGISSMNYANKLSNFVITLFVLSIVTVMYPVISKMAAKKDMEGLKASVRNVISTVVIVIMPAMVMAMMFSKDIVEILFKRGNFDSEAVNMTSNALFFFSIGMMGFALREVLSRVFYSIQDTRTPVINGVIAMVLNIILNLILSRYMGISGLALATSLSVTICTILMAYSLVRKIGSFGAKEIIIMGFKSVISSAAMGIAALIVYKYLAVNISNILSLTSASVVGLIVYVLLAYLLKVDEVHKWINLGVSKIKDLI